jgi:hypothetical protein
MRGGVSTSRRGEEVGRGVGGQTRCKYCEHMYVNGNIRLIETIPDKGKEA